MQHCEISQIFFCEKYVVPAEQTAQNLFRTLPHGKAYANRMVNALATGYLVSVLESICASELQIFLDHEEETVVGSSVKCQHRTPSPPGTILKVDGWVIGIGEHEVTFWVRATDELDIVCEGEVRFAIVQRAQMEHAIRRKCEAIAGRESLTYV